MPEVTKMKINRLETRLEATQEELEINGLEIQEVDDPYKAALICSQLLKVEQKGKSVVLYLGTEMELLGYEIIPFDLSADATSFSRMILAGTTKAKASFVVTGHNHILSTPINHTLDAIIEATQLLGITLLGCFVVNKGNQFYATHSLYDTRPSNHFGMIQKIQGEMHSEKQQVAAKIFGDSAYILLVQMFTISLIAAMQLHLKLSWPLLAAVLIIASFILGTIKNSWLLERYMK